MGENRIRSAIVAQHDEMRGMLREVEELASRCERGVEEGPDLGKQLHERGLALYERFSTHLDQEQELLEPVLRAAGPRGERLANRLAREHDEQRELLDYLLGRLERRPPTLLIARELRNFAEFLRGEMRYEEEALLTPELLGDGGA